MYFYMYAIYLFEMINQVDNFELNENTSSKVEFWNRQIDLIIEDVLDSNISWINNVLKEIMILKWNLKWPIQKIIYSYLAWRLMSKNIHLFERTITFENSSFGIKKTTGNVIKSGILEDQICLLIKLSLIIKCF